MNTSTTDALFTPVLTAWPRRVLLALVWLWLVGTLAFWHWALQPTVWVSTPGTLINLVLLIYVTGIPVWPFYLFLRMRQVNPKLPVPAGLRVAMVVTKAPSEPWELVQHTLRAALLQAPAHDTWLADEQPNDTVRAWCRDHGVGLSSRAGVEAYHRQEWPRRTRCKEGNLAYFYDHYGYANYDVVLQLDADHIPQAGYLLAMLQPFNDPTVGYVAAPSICNLNGARSWATRGRLFAEAVLHGPMQLGCNGVFAPLCIGSHYAVRTQALLETGGLGPELAEDHSTTLLLNAKGWKGAFAHRAICHGLGPETFEDAMLQEFQWSRSLTTILLRYLPGCLPKLPPPLRLQFLYAQVFYPLRGSLSLSGLLLPVLALMLDRPWMAVHYPAFLLFTSLQMLLTVLPVLQVRGCQLLRPMDAKIVSWEQALFELSRGPWILAGVLKAIEEWIRPRPITFRVTRKQVVAQPLPLRFVMPYLIAVLIGLLATLLFGDNTRFARGYVLLTLLTTTLFAITALAVAVLSHRQGRHPLRVHLPQLGLAGGALLVSIGCCLWRLPDLAVPLHTAAALSSSSL